MVIAPETIVTFFFELVEPDIFLSRNIVGEVRSVQRHVSAKTAVIFFKTHFDGFVQDILVNFYVVHVLIDVVTIMTFELDLPLYLPFDLSSRRLGFHNVAALVAKNYSGVFANRIMS